MPEPSKGRPHVVVFAFHAAGQHCLPVRLTCDQAADFGEALIAQATLVRQAEMRARLKDADLLREDR